MCALEIRKRLATLYFCKQRSTTAFFSFFFFFCCRSHNKSGPNPLPSIWKFFRLFTVCEISRCLREGTELTVGLCPETIAAELVKLWASPDAILRYRKRGFTLRFPRMKPPLRVQFLFNTFFSYTSTLSLWSTSFDVSRSSLMVRAGWSLLLVAGTHPLPRLFQTKAKEARHLISDEWKHSMVIQRVHCGNCLRHFCTWQSRQRAMN